MSKFTFALVAAVATTFLSGCVSGRCCPPTSRTARARPTRAAPATKTVVPKKTAPARPWAFYRGEDGKATHLKTMVKKWQDADLVAFGELHGNPVGAISELSTLKTLHAGGRPVALAMEFFERDTQALFDAYLAGDLSYEDLAKQARQAKAFPRTHGPLVKFCKANHIPIIAANAPRRLVSAYRKQEKDYEGFLAGLSEKDRGWMPEETSIVEDEYRAKFVKMMGPVRGPAYFRSQSLWDDSMAEAMYDFRAEHPEYQILFIVGAFHVTRGMGTITKYKMRRGKDDIRLLVMTMDQDASLPFHEDDIGMGDLILKVPYPTRAAAPALKRASPHKTRPTGPNPHVKSKANG